MKSQTMKKKSYFSEFRNEGFGDKVFDICVWFLILLAVCVTLYPFVYVISVSVSSGTAVSRGDVVLFPKGFNLDAYGMVTQYKQLWISYGNTFFYTIVGTFLNIVFTCLAAYPLSRKEFFLRKKLNFFLAFTMYFSGGLIPGYMVVTGLGFYNSRWAMIIPFLLSAYNVMICRSAMEAIPEDLFENAALEGANDFIILTKIAIPLVKPTLAVLTLYYAVARYNDFFNAMLYLGKSQLQPLQMFLRRVLIIASSEILQSAGSTGAAAAAQSTLQIRYVCIVLATIPIICICPFIQKYLVKGTMLGAVKA
ncbi:sugar ABC transporter permease [Anaerocolumna cellulosilytica]|uniref:Sugar ABC transporter permease n=1 Tax=Anaerocolumna cellulosilytica TaxID=433286 RepID=A0A6S6QQQ5_9FIRM|nr:carbohydrate ABC transporter permease [Anaerocolumna cellulosilytica]MBB5196044.1 putative aldouronate transport system permease protein [Anaerocolumna cellulosilytica]BCJ93653.1 sugar ABC transporter permease [Anaerocolumna cellulosilytica]